MQKLEKRATPGKMPTWAAGLGFAVVVYLVFGAFYLMFLAAGKPIPIKASPTQIAVAFFALWAVAYGFICFIYGSEEV
jgi:hypothetical protein